MTAYEYECYLLRRPAGKAPATTAGAWDGKESKLHELIKEECRARGWIYFYSNPARATGRTLGEPDFTILCDGGRVVFLEVKTRTGKLSVAQCYIASKAALLGHTIHVVRSMKEFRDLCSPVKEPPSVS